MRKYLLLMFSLFVLIFCTKQVEATSPVNMKVEVGWNQEYKGNFVPVKVQISSKTLIKGQLRLSQEHKDIQANSIELPAKRIEVPSGTTKEFQLLIPNGMMDPSSRWIITLENEEKVLAKQAVFGRQLMSNTLMIGVISDQSDTLLETEKWIKGIQLTEPIRIHPLKVSDIPTVGRALSSFDVLIISNLAQESLTQSQVNAIHNWVANGGKLLVNGGNNWKSISKGLEEILPVQFQGKTIEISLPDSMKRYKDLPQESVTVVDSRLKEGSIALHSQQDQVVIAKKNYFQGQIYFVAYDILLAPMNQWEGNKQLWNDLYLFTRNVQLNQSNYGEPWIYQVDYEQLKLNQFSEQPSPSHFVLFMVFIVYLLLVGPILFICLRLIGKKEWAWLWIPIGSCLVALGILVYGHWLHGDQVSIYQTGVVQTNSTGVARVRGISTLFSLDKDDYSVRFPKTFVWPGNFLVSFDRQRYLLDQHEDTNLVYQQMPQWSSKLALMESYPSIGGNLQADVFIQDNQVIGEITNSTKYAIKDVWLLFDNQYIKVGDLKPDERKKVSTNMHSKASNAKEGFARKILKGRKSSLFRYAVNISDTFVYSKVHLIGWIDQPIIQSEVANYKYQNKAFYMVQGNVKITKNNKGDWKVPLGWIKADLISSDAGIDFDSYSHQYLSNSDGMAVFSYSLGERPKEIQTFQVGRNRLLNKTSKSIEYEIYNQRTRAWDRQIGSEALDYFDENGQVLLRIRAQANQTFSPPELLIEGR